jgi:adenylate cyclase
MLRTAIDVEPTYARAHALLGWAKWWSAQCYWFGDRREGYRTNPPRTRKMPLRSTPRNRGGAWCPACASRPTASTTARSANCVPRSDSIRAFALGRNGAWLGSVCGRAGSTKRSAETSQAMRLSPLDHFSGFLRGDSRASRCWARSASAKRCVFLRMSVAAFAEYPGHYNTLISCCGHLGLTAEAQEYIAVRNSIGPTLRLGVFAREPEALRAPGCLHRGHEETRYSGVSADGYWPAGADPAPCSCTAGICRR